MPVPVAEPAWPVCASPDDVSPVPVLLLGLEVPDVPDMPPDSPVCAPPDDVSSVPVLLLGLESPVEPDEPAVALVPLVGQPDVALESALLVDPSAPAAPAPPPRVLLQPGIMYAARQNSRMVQYVLMYTPPASSPMPASTMCFPFAINQACAYEVTLA